MRRSLGLGGRIALGAALIVVASLAVLSAGHLRGLRALQRERAEEDLIARARVLARALTMSELAHPGLQERVVRMAEAGDARVTVIAADGSVLADSATENPRELENHGSRPEVVRARAQGHAAMERYSHTVRRPLLYAAAAVGSTGAVVRLARDVPELEAELARSARPFLGLALGVMAFAVAASIVFANRLARPVRELTEAARAVEHGELDRRVHPRGGGEAARLGVAFNRMTSRLQQELGRVEAQAARLATILEGMTEGVLAVGEEERISFLNGAAREILGVEDGSVEGRHLYELVRDPRILSVVQSVASRGEPLDTEVSHEGPPRRLVQIHAAPVGEGGDVILVLRDLSRLRQLERMRTDFVSNVSHELRTPLAAIASAAENLEDGRTREDPVMGPRFVDAIRRNGARLETLLDDILAINRLESRPETLHKVRLCFARVVQAACEDLRDRADRSGVALSVDVPERLTVVGDAQALRRIVDNLVVNAITYTPRGGRVGVKLAADDGAAVLEVADTGIGIPEADLDRVFERFYRVDKARSRSAGGTGLGLAIVKHAVKLHGGDVRVESRVGEGSRFTVRIPRPVEEES